MSENETSRDEETRAPSKRLDRKTLVMVVGFCLMLVVLIALNMK